MKVDISKCPKCNRKLEKWIGDNIYKCDNGHFLALEFKSNLRKTEKKSLMDIYN